MAAVKQVVLAVNHSSLVFFFLKARNYAPVSIPQNKLSSRNRSNVNFSWLTLNGRECGHENTSGVGPQEQVIDATERCLGWREIFITGWKGLVRCFKAPGQHFARYTAVFPLLQISPKQNIFEQKRCRTRAIFRIRLWLPSLHCATRKAPFIARARAPHTCSSGNVRCFPFHHLAKLRKYSELLTHTIYFYMALCCRYLVRSGAGTWRWRDYR